MGIWTYLHPLEDKVVRLLSSEDLPDATLRSFTAALTSRSHFPREREDGVEDEPELAAKPTEEDTLEDFPLLEKAAVAKGSPPLKLTNPNSRRPMRACSTTVF